MDTLTITLLASVITFLIGRYFRAVKVKELDNVSQARDYWRSLYADLQAERAYSRRHTPKFQLVANKAKHHAANDNYLYIEGEINGKREAGLLRLKQWEQAKETLLKNPEDKP